MGVLWLVLDHRWRTELFALAAGWVSHLFADSETNHRTYDVRPTMIGQNLRLIFLLYDGVVPAEATVANAYRETPLGERNGGRCVNPMGENRGAHSRRSFGGDPSKTNVKFEGESNYFCLNRWPSSASSTRSGDPAGHQPTETPASHENPIILLYLLL